MDATSEASAPATEKGPEEGPRETDGQTTALMSEEDMRRAAELRNATAVQPETSTFFSGKLLLGALALGQAFYGYVQWLRVDELQWELRKAREEAFKLRQQYTKTVRVQVHNPENPEEIPNVAAWLYVRARQELARTG